MAMIGRGSFGDPWLFARAKAALEGLPEPELPSLPDRMDVAFRQVCRCAELKGERVACVESRKQLAWYLKGVPHASYYKQQLVQIENLKQLELIIREIRLELR
jgi:tRNA-dihydrouridine synthase B